MWYAAWEAIIWSAREAIWPPGAPLSYNKDYSSYPGDIPGLSLGWGIFLGRGRIQSVFLPAIGPALSRKRSQTSSLYGPVVSQKCNRDDERLARDSEAATGRFRVCTGKTRLARNPVSLILSSLWLDTIGVCHSSRALIGVEPEWEANVPCGQWGAVKGGRTILVTATHGDSRQTVKKQSTNGESTQNKHHILSEGFWNMLWLRLACCSRAGWLLFDSVKGRWFWMSDLIPTHHRRAEPV